MTRITLTKRQGEVLKAVDDAINNNGICPTTKELSQALNISPNTLYWYISALMDYGIFHRVGKNKLEVHTEGYIIEIKNKPSGVCKGYRYGGKKPGRKPYKHLAKKERAKS